MEVIDELECSFDSQSNSSLVGQLKEKALKKAEDQDPEERTVYLMMLDDKNHEKAADAKAEAEKSYHDDCKQNKSQPPDDITITCVFIDPDWTDHGGYGAVYKARSETGTQKSDTKLCIKMGIHRKVRYENDDERARCQNNINKSMYREAANFRLLSEEPHDNIIQFRFSCLSTDNQELMIGLEFFEGVNLSKTIKEHVDNAKPIESIFVHDIMIKSTAAVEYLQTRKIIHCDIKPHNILYNRSSLKLKFVDFGSAIEISEIKNCLGDDKHCWGAGTPEYMAPEILLQKECATITCDIYSLGALFYRLLTLQRPWHFVERVRELRECKKPNYKKCNEEVWGIIKAKYENHWFPDVSADDGDDDGGGGGGDNDTSNVTDSSSERLTELQKMTIDPDKQYFKDNCSECELVKEMLTIDPEWRPSCQRITAAVTKCMDKLSRRENQLSLSDAGEAVPDAAVVPTTVMLLNSTQSGDTKEWSYMTRQHANQIHSASEGTVDSGSAEMRSQEGAADGEVNDEEDRPAFPPTSPRDVGISSGDDRVTLPTIAESPPRVSTTQNPNDYEPPSGID